MQLRQWFYVCANKFDSCIWMRKVDSKLVFIMCIHIDDFLATGEQEWISECYEALLIAFEMKKLEAKR